MSAFSAGFDSTAQRRYREYLRVGGISSDPTVKALTQIPGWLVVRSRRELLADAEWYRCGLFDNYLRGLHIDLSLFSVCQVSDDHAISALCLYRALGDRDFSDRDRQFVRFFHREIGRLIGSSLASVFDPDPLQLPRP